VETANPGLCWPMGTTGNAALLLSILAPGSVIIRGLEEGGCVLGDRAGLLGTDTVSVYEQRQRGHASQERANRQLLVLQQVGCRLIGS